MWQARPDGVSSHREDEAAFCLHFRPPVKSFLLMLELVEAIIVQSKF